MTEDLFEADKAWFGPNQLKLPDDLTEILGRVRRYASQESVERALERLKSETTQFPYRWRQLLAIQDYLASVLNLCGSWWLRGLARSSTLVDLVSCFRDWQARCGKAVNFITFNYDVLLEDAMAVCRLPGFDRRYFDRYLSNEYQLFKPHGSVEWSWKVMLDPGRSSLEERPLSETENASMELLCVGHNQRLMTTNADGTRSAQMAAVAIPVISKSHSNFIFPPGHEAKMLSALESTTALLVIGWAGAEEHFMTEVSSRVRHDIPVLVVCGDKGGAATKESLCAKGKLSNVTDAQYGFSEFLNTARLEEWLEAVK